MKPLPRAGPRAGRAPCRDGAAKFISKASTGETRRFDLASDPRERAECNASAPASEVVPTVSGTRFGTPPQGWVMRVGMDV